MPFTHVTTHVDDAQALLISQFQNKPRLAAWLASYIGEVQALEDVIYDVIVKRLIDNATGAQLDTIGKIVGELRLGRDDTLYRTFIYIRIRVNRSNGWASDVLQILALMDSTPRDFEEVAPANMVFTFATPTTINPYEIFSVLDDAKAGGVGLVLIVPTSTIKQFLFSSVGDMDDPLHGFGDVNAPDDNGLLSTVIT